MPGSTPPILIVVLLTAGAACARDGAEQQPAATDSGVARGDTARADGDTARVDTSSAAPAFRILAPDSGTVWREGERYVIRWTGPRAGRVNVGAVVGGKDRGHLAFDIPAGTDSLPWRVPDGFVSGFGPTRSDAVRIRVERTDDPRVGVTSAPFTIVAP